MDKKTGRKITIIGAGAVGSTIAYSLSQRSHASEIVLIDVNIARAKGEALDIVQSTSFRDPIRVKYGDYEEAANSDIVIITSGIGRKPGQTRLELTKTNVGIIKEIAPQITKVAPNAIYIIVSNPVDILTYVFTKVSGIPENQIIGTGTILDSARLKCILAQKLNIAQKNVHSYVFGEHGDTSFIPWSTSRVSGVSIDEYISLVKQKGMSVETIDKDEIFHYVQKSGGEIIKDKGATFYGIAASVMNLVNMLTSAYDSITCCSTMMHGEYGVNDVCLSCLTIIGPNGVQGKIPMPMTNEEIDKMQHSERVLREIIDGLDI